MTWWGILSILLLILLFVLALYAYIVYERLNTYMVIDKSFLKNKNRCIIVNYYGKKYQFTFTKNTHFDNASYEGYMFFKPSLHGNYKDIVLIGTNKEDGWKNIRFKFSN